MTDKPHLTATEATHAGMEHDRMESQMEALNKLLERVDIMDAVRVALGYPSRMPPTALEAWLSVIDGAKDVRRAFGHDRS